MTTPRTLIVLTSHDELGNTGKRTGAYLSEITHVYWPLFHAGIEVDFVSPRGGQVPLDGVDRKDAFNERFLDNADLMARLANTLRPADVDPARYGAIYYAGGHGTMWDLPNDAALARIAAAIYEAGGYVSAVCHGPSGLVNVKLSNGAYLVAGKQVAAFTNDEEKAVNLTDVVPFLLASTLTERGATHIPAANFAANVIESERLITGQNPASAKGVGEAIVRVLSKQPSSKTGLASVLLSLLVGCATTGAEPAQVESGKADGYGSRVVLTGFEQPEAVEWDDRAHVWYVSNFGGAPQMDGIDKDGDGFISRVSANGKQVDKVWIGGLDAPKGMRLVGRTLFVVDVNQVVAIDVTTRTILNRYPIDHSIFLNDIDAAPDGTLYVTDTLANAIFKIDPAGKVSTFASGEQLENPNGIRVDGDRLVIAAWGPITDPMTFATSRPGDLYALANGEQTVIAKELGNLDGLELSDGGFLVTSWAGTVLDVDRDGTVAPIADGFKSDADVRRAHGRIAIPELLEGKLTLISE